MQMHQNDYAERAAFAEAAFSAYSNLISGFSRRFQVWKLLLSPEKKLRKEKEKCSISSRSPTTSETATKMSNPHTSRSASTQTKGCWSTRVPICSEASLISTTPYMLCCFASSWTPMGSRTLMVLIITNLSARSFSLKNGQEKPQPPHPCPNSRRRTKALPHQPAVLYFI